MEPSRDPNSYFDPVEPSYICRFSGCRKIMKTPGWVDGCPFEHHMCHTVILQLKV